MWTCEGSDVSRIFQGGGANLEENRTSICLDSSKSVSGPRTIIPYNLLPEISFQRRGEGGSIAQKDSKNPKGEAIAQFSQQ